MHDWVGEGGCKFYSLPVPVMIITASNVTVKNFGFKNASLGIQLAPGLRSVTIDNVEGLSCLKGIDFPDSIYDLNISNSNFVGFDGVK